MKELEEVATRTAIKYAQWIEKQIDAEMEKPLDSKQEKQGTTDSLASHVKSLGYLLNSVGNVGSMNPFL